MRMKQNDLCNLFTQLFMSNTVGSSSSSSSSANKTLSLPSFAAVRRAITESVVLPLGSQVIHDLAPWIKGVFLYGFPATGKTLATFAACNEAGAMFFNLSPDNFVNVKGIAKTIQAAFALARLKAPSVLYLDHVDKVFPAKGSVGKRSKAKKGGGKDLLLLRGKKMKK
uniref:IQ and AAA domain-containing protein 1-like protein n=2 Tax=Lygus hesperus TaxID=30085 RepID=A0A0A9YJS5_LYGHE